MNASIRWPSGLVQQLHNLPINHRIWVEEGADPSRFEPFGKASQASNVSQDGLDNLVIQTWLLVPMPRTEFLSDWQARGCSIRGG